MAWIVPRAGEARTDAGDVVLYDLPGSPASWHGRACRPRFDPASADERIAGVRAWFRDRGRSSFTWMVGQSATPSDLVERLLATGARREADNQGDATGLVLDVEPPALTGIEVRRVRDLDDFRAVRRIDAEAFDVPDEVLRGLLERSDADYEASLAFAALQVFVALLDGEPAAYGNLAFLMAGPPLLVGGGTRVAARGRGLYRALVRARWDAAVAAGHRSLITQASPQSEPILRRLGFRGGPRLVALVDEAG